MRRSLDPRNESLDPGARAGASWGERSSSPLSAFGERARQPDEIEFQGKLASARLSATFDLFDSMTQTTHSATLELTWTATGPISHAQERNSYFAPGSRYTSRLQGTERRALATGSLLLDSVEALDGPSY
jgi:hypothetical protein